MVIAAARHLVVVMLLTLLYSAGVQANDRFIVENTSGQVELGKHFYIELRSTLQSSSLADIDLTALKNDFYVREKSEVVYDALAGQQLLRLKLYARSEGALTIPSLQFAGQSSLPIPIKVTRAIDPKTGKPLQVVFEYDKHPLWTKQQWVVKAGLVTDEQIVRMETEQATLTNFDQTTITPAEPVQTRDGRYRHETGWVLFPAKAGHFDLELPAIKYYRDGVNTHNFFPPRLHIWVRPLPVYIPGIIPVGRLSIRLDGPSNPFLISGDLNHYQVQIIGEGIQLADMPIITLQAQEPSQALQYQYIKEEQQDVQNGGMSSRVAYRFPFVTAKTGLVSFSKIRLQYFDPVSGRLHSQTFNPGSWLSLPLWLAVLLIMLVAAITVYIIRLTGLWLLKKWRYFRTCKSVLHTIATSTNYNDYKSALQVLVEAEGWLKNPSLLQIKHFWAHHIPETGEKLGVIDLLMRSLYRGEKVQVELLRQQLLSLVYSRRRLFRYL